VAVQAKIAARYRLDRPAIARALGYDPGRLVSIDPGWGDPHRGGQTVARVATDSGSHLAWKPRSVEPERLWAGVVLSVEEELRIGLSAPLAWGRRTHGWVEWIESERVPNGTPGDNRRLGALLALLDFLEVRDAHRDNFVLARGQPVLVDAETIGHPRLPGFEGVPSIVLTGALPWPPGAANRRIGGSTYRRSSGSAEEVARGYLAVHRFIREAGPAWFRPTGVLGRFRKIRIRVILRPTRVYASALRRGFTQLKPPPGVTDPRASGLILGSERRALRRGDIPIFETTLDGTELRDERGVLAPRFFAKSGWSTIIERWGRLDARDARASLRLVRSCLRLDQAARGGGLR
jgi:lantibiotic modifying enzyme